jgi:hypothetical protein
VCFGVDVVSDRGEHVGMECVRVCGMLKHDAVQCRTLWRNVVQGSVVVCGGWGRGIHVLIFFRFVWATGMGQIIATGETQPLITGTTWSTAAFVGGGEAAASQIDHATGQCPVRGKLRRAVPTVSVLCA